MLIHFFLDALLGCQKPSESIVQETSNINTWLSIASKTTHTGLLGLADTNLNDETFGEILDHPSIPAIQELRLASNNLGVSGASILAHHPKLTGLKYLSLAQNPLKDAGLEILSQGAYVSSVEELDITGVGGTGVGVKSIASNFTNLKRLYVSYQSLDDDAIQTISKLPYLVLLSAVETQLSPKAVKFLLQSSIKTLNLEGNILEEGSLVGLDFIGSEGINLSRTGLSDQDVAILALADAPSLVSLKLAHCAISDEGAQTLIQSILLMQLQALDLSYTQISSQAAHKLKAAWGDRGGLTLPKTKP